MYVQGVDSIKTQLKRFPPEMLWRLRDTGGVGKHLDEDGQPILKPLFENVRPRGHYIHVCTIHYIHVPSMHGSLLVADLTHLTLCLARVTSSVTLSIMICVQQLQGKEMHEALERMSNTMITKIARELESGDDITVGCHASLYCSPW